MDQQFLVKECNDLNSTKLLGQTIGHNLRGGEIIELSSDLGGGKTTLVKAIVEGTGSEDLVSSPSFTICNQYRASNFTIYHYDFYRLTDPGIMKQELEENIADDRAVIIIEWPGIVEGVLPKNRLSIDIEVTGDDARKFHFTFNQDIEYLLKDVYLKI
ncbi:MAG TPA: tRNA (adenosine(37)-N6)-threonylcarbamoyltransferase complex ATPase subunit type 1 TsaE [Candidatus Saccharimonadales bacterium]